MPYKDPEVRKRKHKEYSKRHYEKNKQATIDRSAEVRKSFKAQWEIFKAAQVCTHCGFSHPAAIDFHHVIRSPDNKKLYKLLTNRSFKSALEEVKKCIPLCANCHRILHHNERIEDKKRGKKPKNPAKIKSKTTKAYKNGK